ncbi:MAG: hypothetical protein NWP37_00570 [Pontimonas sp.]|nr:hypothetical protein [Pontimonas sp.]
MEDGLFLQAQLTSEASLLVAVAVAVTPEPAQQVAVVELAESLLPMRCRYLAQCRFKLAQAAWDPMPMVLPMLVEIVLSGRFWLAVAVVVVALVRQILRNRMGAEDPTT